mmetsp:Transcript_94882/g.217236  ORF Transcript_94882/g.217236 Transcript_94882/m.217236 type:complete len:532 (-) Transcript_94882:443-2038(-)
MDQTLLVGMSEGQAFLWRLLAQVVWYLMLQVLLGWICGVISLSPQERTDLCAAYKVAREKKLILDPAYQRVQQIKIRANAGGTLLAHITGFAAINAWGGLQQATVFRISPVTCLLVIPLAVLFCGVLNKTTEVIRFCSNTGTDRALDPLEKVWDEEVKEAENEISALYVSFCVVQVIRFAVSGILPDSEGGEDTETLFSHTWPQIIALEGCGMIGIILCCAVFFRFVSVEENEDSDEESDDAEFERLLDGEDSADSLSDEAVGCFGEVSGRGEYYAPPPLPGQVTKEVCMFPIERVVEMLLGGLGMGFAWCFFFGSQWFVAMTGVCGIDETQLQVAVAMSVSVVSFAWIFLLDKVADALQGNDEDEEVTADVHLQARMRGKIVGRFIRRVISAIGIIVGFAWEQCFDAAVDAVASVSSNPLLVQTILALFCAALICPAWASFILPMVHQKGWRFGFVATQVATYAKALTEEDEESAKEYERLLSALALVMARSQAGGESHRQRRQSLGELVQQFRSQRRSAQEGYTALDEG